ncbi:hypothetical protein [Nocardioides convexus]|uniref:hypothetical protein n=1 Tax=Nocardioides convexus TaxID=2712224 RepID=UPI002418A8C0|nr:hypothetical protein [Nocardioides convexus]
MSALLSTSSSSAPGDPPGSDDLLPPGKYSLTQGVTSLTQGTVVRRSKMYITINSNAPMWAAIYPYLYNTPVDNPTSLRGWLHARSSLHPESVLPAAVRHR